MHAKIIKYCFACGYDLSTAYPAFPDWPDSNSQSLLERLVREFELCPWKGFPLDVASPIPFFIGMRVILNLLNGRYGRQLQKVLCSELSINVVQSSTQHFEYLDTNTRLHLLLCACWLIQFWPDRFVRSCRAAGLSRSRILEEPDASPFWLESVLSTHLDNRTYSPSQEEFTQASAYLLSRGLDLTTQNIVELLGIQRDAARRIIKVWSPYL